MFTEYTREEIQTPSRENTALPENENFKAVDVPTTENKTFEAEEYIATDYNSPIHGQYDLDGESLW